MLPARADGIDVLNPEFLKEQRVATERAAISMSLQQLKLTDDFVAGLNETHSAGSPEERAYRRSGSHNARARYLKVVSEWLGHSTIGITTDLYTHVADQLHETAAASLDSYLGPTIKRR
jgi:integrase